MNPSFSPEPPETPEPEGLSFAGTMRRGSFELEAAFTCAPGEVLGVLGPNGSGKSTLVAGISGLEHLTSGELRVGEACWDDGRGHAVPPGRRQVGLMTAAGDIFGHLDALENVAFGLRARGVSRSAARRRARQELEQVGIADLASRRPHELSSGQAQRVALARALALAPRVLLLDEPLSAIDQSGRDELRALLGERLARTDAVTLLVTHDPLEALTLADRLLFLEAGRVTQLAPPQDVVRYPRTAFAARVVGLNLWRGTSDGRAITTPGGARIMAADVPPSGERAFAAFAPTAVSLWREVPAGSPRNTWPLVVQQIEHTGTSARVHLRGDAGVAADLVADVTLEAVTELGLHRGSHVAASVKATDVTLYR